MSTIDHLIAGWRLLRLAAAAPDRVAGWDAVVLTASGPAQAALYRANLAAMQRRGRLSERTRIVVVEDPAGRRIGSGGATLNALRALCAVFGSAEALAQARVLLVHAGGDSRRLPWASVVGKAFLPLPLAADPDQPCPSLVDHLVALCAGIPARWAKGGLLALSGDVLPLGDLTQLDWPSAGLGVVTVPAPAALAGRHGVIAADAAGRVTALLQKPDAAALAAGGALLPGGRALLDTGVWSLAPDAVRALADLAIAPDDALAELLADGRECSLYEELPAACLPERQAWLRQRPLGQRLLTALAGTSLSSVRASDLRFLHLGTGSELLEHLAGDWSGNVQRRQLAEAGPAVAAEAILLDSRVDPAARIGAGSLVVHSRLGPRATLGRRCVVQGVDAPDEPLALPDHHAVWQVPLRGADGSLTWVSAWCGVDDNPKAPLAQATLGNRPLSAWLAARALSPEDCWPEAGTERSLWTAQLFPGSPGAPALGVLGWMVGDPAAHPAGAALWRQSRRWSLAELAAGFDAATLLASQQHRADRVALGVLTHVARHGLDRDVGALVSDCSPGARPALLTLADSVPPSAPISLARRHWLRGEFLAGAGATEAAAVARQQAWSAIAEDLATRLDGAAVAALAAPAPELAPGSSALAELPARVDLAGGWTDTPPLCFDQPARVCNLAITLAGRRPIGARLTVTEQPGLRLELDGPGAPDPVDLPWSALAGDGRFPLSDPYALVKAALVACGWQPGSAAARRGLRVEAWSHLPRGSGLGGSSILAAALVAACGRLSGRDHSIAAVSALVLTVEQRLSTGGGWQDQLGGLVPGAKLLSSLPQSPLRIDIQPIPLAPAEVQTLEQRLLVIDTGLTRLAKDVLQRVLGGYLSRRHTVMRAAGRLADLASSVRDCLAIGDYDGLGDQIREAWSLNQALDPHCSNPAVDNRFAGLPGAWKLTGAGGGGFAVYLIPGQQARDDAIRAVTQRGLRVVEWGLDVGGVRGEG